MITLRPSSDFDTNGALRGGIIAYDDMNEPLWEATGNWSDRRFLKSQAKDMAAFLSKTEEWALAKLTEAARLARKAGDAAEAAKRSAPTPALPRVSVTGRRLREMASDAWDLLAAVPDASDHRLYVRGGVTVDLTRSVGPLKSRDLNEARLRWHLERVGDWQKDGSTGPYPVTPPKVVLEDMLADPAPPLPQLSGITYSPIVTPSGEVLTRSGYHAGSGYYLELGELRVVVSERPTKEEITNARRLLLEELLVDFPFISEADRTHAVEGILAPIIRPLIPGPTPLRMVEAPTPGSGKGKYIGCVGEIVLGGPVRSLAEAHDDDEWRKGITAALLDARPVIAIDNVRRRLDSGPLAKALTDQQWSDRQIRTSKTLDLPVQTSWYATANNPTYSDEIAGRIVRTRIDPAIERPRERTGFRHEQLLEWVRQERPLLLCAVLTLVRAWLVEGRPRGKYVMGSYEEWAAITGGILDVAGLPAFLGNRGETYDRAETELKPWRELVLVWWGAYRGQRVGVDKLFSLAKDQDAPLLVELRSGRNDHSARILMGRWLASMRDRVVAGYHIRHAGESRTGTAEYRLDPARTEARKPDATSAEIMSDPAHPANSRDSRGSAGSQRYLGPEFDRARAAIDDVYGRSDGRRE